MKKDDASIRTRLVLSIKGVIFALIRALLSADIEVKSLGDDQVSFGVCLGGESARVKETHTRAGVAMLALASSLAVARVRVTAAVTGAWNKTIRDAIHVVRHLKVNLPWVDSLCIMQDDTD